MSKMRREGLFRKTFVIGFFIFMVTITLMSSAIRPGSTYGCPTSSYDYCDENFGMWVNPYSCNCAPYCGLLDSDCAARGGEIDYDHCRCIMPPIMFEPCTDYNASQYCGGNRFDESFSGITWVYGAGNCNPQWEFSCAQLGGSFNYNTCNCDLGPAYIPPTAGPTPPSTERCPAGSAAETACIDHLPPGKFDRVNCTCKWGP